MEPAPGVKRCSCRSRQVCSRKRRKSITVIIYIEQRYGGLRTRLESFEARLKAYVDGKILSIPEFETKLEKIVDTDPGDLPYVNHARVLTASKLK